MVIWLQTASANPTPLEALPPPRDISNSFRCLAAPSFARHLGVVRRPLVYLLELLDQPCTCGWLGLKHPPM